jgi:hypothetical protein
MIEWSSNSIKETRILKQLNQESSNEMSSTNARIIVIQFVTQTKYEV